eukprot:4653718-Ditylum_brightwellii.AAC.1
MRRLSEEVKKGLVNGSQKWDCREWQNLAERWRIGRKGIMAHNVHLMDQNVERFYQIESIQIGGDTKTE